MMSPRLMARRPREVGVDIEIDRLKGLIHSYEEDEQVFGLTTEDVLKLSSMRRRLSELQNTQTSEAE